MKLSIHPYPPSQFHWLAQIEADLDGGLSPTELCEALTAKDHCCYVAFSGNRIVGYVIYREMDYRLDLIRVAVHPRHWHCGAGHLLVNFVLQKLGGSRAEVHTVIHECNYPAWRLLRSLGFLAVKVLRGYFVDRDAYKLVYAVPYAQPALEAELERARDHSR